MLKSALKSRECQLSSGSVIFFQFVRSKKLQAFLVSNISIKNNFVQDRKFRNQEHRIQNQEHRKVTSKIFGYYEWSQIFEKDELRYLDTTVGKPKLWAIQLWFQNSLTRLIQKILPFVISKDDFPTSNTHCFFSGFPWSWIPAHKW